MIKNPESRMCHRAQVRDQPKFSRPDSLDFRGTGSSFVKEAEDVRFRFPEDCVECIMQMSGPTLSTTDRARHVIRVRAEDNDSTVRDKDGNAEVDEDGVKDAKADSDKDEASEVDDERDDSAEQTELDEEADDKDQDEDREAFCGPSKLAEE
ncbi:uncharacterized protein STEHIDRAFT_115923 [Stereum hirsutum FP-91666 SS1]|uniref:Uncharacterized protein n=1 Tax=Stereum hirsutum (strain FP-91666) TaxID=721885 RepID=R7S058_STEHR|nr:uncharacterized protein STEHIDRAFT_115923 [Stereum hirsutum FP-91666 SS1]EIM80498.1 hypothetical protein STEHIDRAFT_115923 [Stereum hirsutum FP-91666 SS1]